jgi:hypothetical protein
MLNDALFLEILHVIAVRNLDKLFLDQMEDVAIFQRPQLFKFLREFRLIFERLFRTRGCSI